MIEDSFLDAVVSAHLPHRLDLLLELLEVLGLRFASEDGDLRPAGSGDQCHCRFSSIAMDFRVLREPSDCEVEHAFEKVASFQCLEDTLSPSRC